VPIYCPQVIIAHRWIFSESSIRQDHLSTPPCESTRPIMPPLSHAVKHASVFAVTLAASMLASCMGATVHFPSLDTVKATGRPVELEAMLEKPSGPGPFPAIILMHGCSGIYSTGKQINARQAEWAQLLLNEGYVVLHLDSFNPRGYGDVCSMGPQPVLPYPNRGPDARGALHWLQSQPYVKPNRIAVLGWSHGGMSVLFAVDSYRYPHRPSDSAPNFRVAVSFYPLCTGMDKSKWFTTVPTMLLIGEADDWTPAPPCRALAERTQTTGRPIEFVSYPGAYHGFEAPGVPVRVMQGIPTAVNGHSVTIGTDPKARADALTRVPQFLAKYLKD